MAKPISMEKRAAIIKHMQAGESKESISKWLFVCIRTITRVWNKYQITGSYEPEPLNSGRNPLVDDDTMKKVIEKIKQTPDITILELIDEFKLPISESAMCKRLIKVGLTYKKRHSTQMLKKEKML